MDLKLIEYYGKYSVFILNFNVDSIGMSTNGIFFNDTKLHFRSLKIILSTQTE